jgi:hypothetical protein
VARQHRLPALDKRRRRHLQARPGVAQAAQVAAMAEEAVVAGLGEHHSEMDRGMWAKAKTVSM